MMEGKEKEEGPTKKELSYLKTLKAILPKIYKRNYKSALNELNFIKGVKKRELVKFITSVYDLEEKQVARAMALGSKKLTLKEQTRKAKSHKVKETPKKRGTRQPRYCTKKKNSYVLSKAKQRALTRIDELCGICGGSKKKRADKCKKKKKKEDKCKKKKEEDPCKKKKRRRRSSCRKRKPAGKTCDYGPGPTEEPSNGGTDTSKSNDSNAKQTTKDGGVNEERSNSTDNTKPESERPKQLYIS